jgi:hypothetical protein
MADLSGALQAAIFAAVDAALTQDVYDAVPDGLADDDFPYVTVNDVQPVDWSTKSFAGQDFAVNLHVWSRYAGNKEIQDIYSALHTALNNVTLAVAGATCVLCRYEASQTPFPDPDGRTRHGVIRFRVLLQHT